MATIKQIKDTDGNVHDILSTIGYGTCATAAATAAKVATISDTSWTLKVGTIIGIKYTNSNSAGSSTTPVTLNVNSTGAKNIWYNNAKYTGTSTSICGYANRVLFYMYDGTYWVWMNMGSLDGNSNTVPSFQIETAAATAAKVGTCTNYSLLANSYSHANIRYSNTSKTALTLNVNSKGAKPIYINGAASSTSNYTLPAGTYIVYYDGTNYHFRTDGVIPGKILDANRATRATGADKADALTVVSKGSATQPVYFDANGKPVACTYTLGKTVPSGAAFTDTKNTTGTTNKASTKLFLAGAETQVDNPVTYSNINCYIGTDNCLYSGGSKTLTSVPDDISVRSISNTQDDDLIISTVDTVLSLSSGDEIQMSSVGGLFVSGAVCFEGGENSEHVYMDTDLTVTGTMNINSSCEMEGDLTVNGTISTGDAFVGNLAGNADTATSATNDSLGRQISTTYAISSDFSEFTSYVEETFAYKTGSLKNPNAIKFKNTVGVVITYDGSSAADLSNGVYYAATAGSANSAGTAGALTSKSKGSATQPVYFDANGKPVACTYTLSKSVPSGAAFTDTKNTTGTTNKASTKLFLAGAETQVDNPVTYSNINCYIGTDNCLYSGGSKVLTSVPADIIVRSISNTHDDDLTISTVDKVLSLSSGDEMYLSSTAGLFITGSVCFEGGEHGENVYMDTDLTVTGTINGNLNGTATTATNANNVMVNVTNTNEGLPMVFTTFGSSAVAANKALYMDSTKSLLYNPNQNTVTCAGGFFETSDERLKDIVNPITVDLDKLSKLRKVYFNWKDKPDSNLQLGMIAQDVQELYPELVSEMNGQLSLSYEKLSVIALEAIDVLHNENNELKSRIERLESLVNQLAEKVND